MKHKKFGMVIDLDKCTGCGVCARRLSDWAHCGQGEQSWARRYHSSAMVEVDLPVCGSMRPKAAGGGLGSK